MLKVHILATCSHCNGEAYLPFGEAEDCQGHKYTRHIPCPVCEGSGNEPKWVNLEDFAKLMQQEVCPHENTSYQGNMHFSALDEQILEKGKTSVYYVHFVPKSPHNLLLSLHAVLAYLFPNCSCNVSAVHPICIGMKQEKVIRKPVQIGI